MAWAALQQSPRRGLHPPSRSRRSTQAQGVAAVQMGQYRAGQPQDHAVRRLQVLRLRQVRSDRYLGAFACRFNRRFDLADLVVRLIVDVCRGMPAPERVIRYA